MVQVGDRVKLVAPENPYVNNQFATVKVLTDYGAVVAWSGGSGEFRAFEREMVAAVATGDVCKTCGGPRMVRTGTCLTCLDCGDSSGGCS